MPRTRVNDQKVSSVINVRITMKIRVQLEEEKLADATHTNNKATKTTTT